MSTAIEQCRDNIDKAYFSLLRDARYYAKLFNLTKKVITLETPTASIRITKDGPLMRINPHFFNSLGVLEGADVLKHELEHVLRRHRERENTLEPDLYREDLTLEELLKVVSKPHLFNIAEDRTINDCLSNLPKKIKYFDRDGNQERDKLGNLLEGELVTKESFNKRFLDVEVRDNEPMEYYYGLLLSNKDFNSGNLPLVPLDFGEEDEVDGQLKKEIIKQTINEAYDSLTEQEKGNVPFHIKTIINKINQSDKDWKDDLSHFNQSCLNVTKRFSRSKRNKRYGWDQPGRKVKRELTLVAVIDNSASIREPQLNAFISELQNLSDLGTKIIVIICDAEIQEVFEFSSSKDITITGRGGTSFAPPFEYIKTDKFIREYGEPNGLIYFTDGEDWKSIEEEPQLPVLWALLPGCKVSYDWGKITHITVPEE